MKVLSAALAASVFWSVAAPAQELVYDPSVTTAVLEDTTVNAGTLAAVLLLKKSLGGDGSDTMIDHTVNIDNSTTDIDKSTQNIEQYSEETKNYTQNISEIATNNYNLDASFTWNTSNYFSDGDPSIIPVGVDNNNYHDADFYKDSVASSANLADIGVQGSSDQKTANDALSKTLASSSNSLQQQAQSFQNLVGQGLQAQGQANQLRVGNAIAATQTAQLMEMRGVMIASENARSASAQASADQSSREIASAQSLRGGMDQANAGTSSP